MSLHALRFRESPVGVPEGLQYGAEPEFLPRIPTLYFCMRVSPDSITRRTCSRYSAAVHDLTVHVGGDDRIE